MSNANKRNSNGYTFLYATLLIIVVAATLAFASQVLKPRQESNMLTEKRLYILRAAHLAPDAYTVTDRNAYVEKEYNTYIRETVVEDSLSSNGNSLPLYICTLSNGETKFIIPLQGNGLWGPIWGYIALNEDGNTIYGAIFDHKGETPGLGAEITQPFFSDAFAGKSLFQEGQFVSLTVKKGGGTADNPHAVDAVSGGTITSRGVESMLRESLTPYVPFFTHQLHNVAGNE